MTPAQILQGLKKAKQQYKAFADAEESMQAYIDYMREMEAAKKGNLGVIQEIDRAKAELLDLQDKGAAQRVSQEKMLEEEANFARQRVREELSDSMAEVQRLKTEIKEQTAYAKAIQVDLKASEKTLKEAIEKKSQEYKSILRAIDEARATARALRERLEA